MASSDEEATTWTRWSKCVRPAFAVKQRSPKSTSGLSTSSLSYLAVKSCRAASDFAEMHRIWVERRILSDVLSRNGPSSITTWAFVPLNPKEDTPATRRLLCDDHGIQCDGITTRACSSDIIGLMDRRFTWGGIILFCIARMTLIIPATPAAPSRCPKFALTDPTANRWSVVLSAPSTDPSASISMGSPSDVPVPCAST